MAKRLKTTWHITFFAAVLLFAQFAVASQACMVMHQQAGTQHAMTEECDGTPMNDDSCLAQCIAQDQVSSTLEHHFTAAPPVIARAAPDFPLVATLAPTRLLPDAPLPAGPPLQVLFCSYQT